MDAPEERRGREAGCRGRPYECSGAAAKYHRQYVSALAWDLEFLPDRLHLTPAGHLEFSELVAAAVR